MQPSYIRNPEELATAVTIGVTTENIVLDFKQTIDWRFPKGTSDEIRANRQKEICKDISQFANTSGGCLLIGVAERRDPVTNLKVADAIQPVTEADGMKQWIEQAIRNYLVPATFSRDIAVVNDPRGTVLALNVPPSIHVVSLWDRQQHTIECVRRTSHGKEWMNPDELERHIMNGSRATKLAFDRALESVPKREARLAGGYWQRADNPAPGARDQVWAPKQPVTIGQVEEEWFELQIPYPSEHRSLTIPYGVIEQVWVGGEGAVNLLLSIRVVLQNGQFAVEPRR